MKKRTLPPPPLYFCKKMDEESIFNSRTKMMARRQLNRRHGERHLYALETAEHATVLALDDGSEANQFSCRREHRLSDVH
jgi:hypothetical protein